MSMESAVENAVYIREVLEEILNLKKKQMELNILSDSKSLIDAVRGNKPIGNKQLRMNVEIIKQSLREKDVTTINWVPSEKMIADILTKKGVNPVPLRRILETGIRNNQSPL